MEILVIFCMFLGAVGAVMLLFIISKTVGALVEYIVERIAEDDKECPECGSRTNRVEDSYVCSIYNDCGWVGTEGDER